MYRKSKPGPRGKSETKTETPESKTGRGAVKTASRVHQEDTVQAALSTHRSLFDTSFFQQAARLGVAIADALHHAHQHGIVHRDIKPGNLMVDRSAKVWITDFGLARIESDAGMTMTGDLVGTLRYMAPEQALAKRIVVDHRADIYSLGVTLYELLALRPVYAGASREELLKQLAFDEPKPIRQFHADVPADLEMIVLKAISKDPDERYTTAAEMADDLRAFSENRPIKARRPTIIQRTTKWSRRHKTLVNTAAASLAVAILISGMLLWREQSKTLAALGQVSEQREQAEQNAAEAKANFDLAREAVDRLFTKLAEEDLLDQPHMQELRKSLLTDALTYLSEVRDAAGQRTDSLPRYRARLPPAGRHLPRTRPVQ